MSLTDFRPTVKRYDEVEGPDGKPLYSLILDEETLRAILGGWGPADIVAMNRWLHAAGFEEVTNTDPHNTYPKIVEVLQDE